MKISKIKVNNYRLLKSFELEVEEKLSLIIGKNNTGKTSLFSVLSKFLNPSSRKGFLYNDFNTDFKKIVENSVINAEIEKEKYEDVSKNHMDNHEECFYLCGRCRRRQVAYENYNENGAVFPVCCGGREEHGSSVYRRHRVHSGMGGIVAF